MALNLRGMFAAHVNRPSRQRAGEDEPFAGSAQDAAEGVVGGVAGDVEEDFHSTPPETGQCDDHAAHPEGVPAAISQRPT